MTLRLFLLSLLIWTTSARSADISDTTNILAPETTQQCGQIQLLEVADTGEANATVPLKTLEVATGFSWQRGLVQTERYILSAQGPLPTTQGRIRLRQKLLSPLKPGDRVCVHGRLFYRNDEFLFPVLVPERVGPWITTANYESESTLIERGLQ